MVINAYIFSNILSVMLILTVIFCAMPVYAEGGTYTVSFPVTVSNPNNNIPAGTKFTLTIEGQPHAPLPEPSAIVAESNETYQFAPIEFNEPGNYRYTVTQNVPDDDKLIPDVTAYEILVTVIRNDSGDLEGGYSVYDQAEQNKHTMIAFSNDYRVWNNDQDNNNGNADDKNKDSDNQNGNDNQNRNENNKNNTSSDQNSEHSPGTGEPLSPAFGGLILSSGLFMLFLTVRKRLNTVDYYLIPRNLEALAEIERRVAEKSPPLTTSPNYEYAEVPFTNTATCREIETSAVTYMIHKNDIRPVTKTPKKMPVEAGEYNQLHPKYSFQINLNPGKIKMNDGTPMQVTDTYSSSLSIDYRSIEISTFPEDRKDQVYYDFSGNVGKFIIPDETHVMITYTAKIIEAPGASSDLVPFSNTVEVRGMSATVSDNAEIKVKSSGEAITPEIYIYKYRSNHMEDGLNGAVFKLYELVGRDENDKPIYSPIKVHNEDFTMTSAYDSVAKKNGQIHLKLDQQLHGFNLSPDKTYCIHEETPPENYTASIVWYEFIIRQSGEVDYSKREYLLGDTLTVRNSPKAINVNLKKQIDGNVRLTSQDLAELRFKLEKYDSETKTWSVFGGYDNLQYVNFTSSDGVSSTVLNSLGLGKYRITESGNAEIEANHKGSTAYVRYDWEDNTSGTSAVAEFEITQNHLDNAEDRTITFTDTFSTETVDRKATKKWYDAKGNEINWPKGLKVKLEVLPQEEISNPDSTPVQTVELDGVADDNGELTAGTASFNGLPKYKADGQTFEQYAVREATVFKGYQSDQTSYLMENSQAVLIKNTKRSTNLTITKRWTGGAPTNATATICLWGYPQKGSQADAKLLSSQTVTGPTNADDNPDNDGEDNNNSGGEDWLIEFKKVPTTNDADIPYDYFFTEIGCTPGYEPSYEDNNTSAEAGGIITNAIAKTTFKVTKQWSNTAGNEWPSSIASIPLTIKRVKSSENDPDNDFSIACSMSPDGCTPGTLPGGVSLGVTAEDGGKYCLEIKGLEKYAPDGTLWSYCATEGKLNGFTAIYKDDTHADVTATRGNAPNGGYIINTGDSYSLTVSKTVTGNYADRNYYFPFTVSMADAKGKPFEGSLRFIKTGAPSGDVDAELTFSGGQAAFTLCHGESITFAHVPDGMIYSVTEERSGARGYTVQTSLNGTPRKESDSPHVVYGPIKDGSGNVLGNQIISYTNDKSRILPTGVELQIGSSVASFLLFTIGLAFLMLRRKNRGDSDS